MLQQWISHATNEIELLACDQTAGEQALLALQVTTRSPMGALAYSTGGLLVDGGWMRVLGAGCARLPRSIAGWNGRLPGAMLVGDDAIGGFFAVNGGALNGASGHVHYFAPDTLAWESMNIGYSDWLRWICAGDVATYYAKSKWTSWRDEVANLSGDSAFSFYPPLFTKADSIDDRSRRVVPLAELWNFHNEVAKQLT
jgi:hypothetical protein